MCVCACVRVCISTLIDHKCVKTCIFTSLCFLPPTIQAAAAASDDFLAYKTASIVYRQATKAIPGERTSLSGDGGRVGNGTREFPTDNHFGVI